MLYGSSNNVFILIYTMVSHAIHKAPASTAFAAIDTSGDLMMPEMDGLQMTEILRSNPETEEVPIIAATGAFRRQDRQNCMGVGCNDYIVKPFKLQELRKKINALVQQASNKDDS